MALNIRLATADDISCLNAIELAAGRIFPAGRLPSPDQVHPVAELQAAQHNNLLLVAEVQQQPHDWVIVGFAVAEHHPPNLHLAEISVHPDHGGKGIGRAMLNCVLHMAAELKCTGTSLTTFSDIQWNAPFYASAGFQVVPDADHTPVMK